MAVLDVSGSWVAGDDVRCLSAMEMAFSEYSLNGLITCMNQLQAISDAMVQQVRVDLDRYEAAKTVEIGANVADSEGKVLVKADVLEWEVAKGVSGARSEMNDASNAIMRAFGFCPYTPKSGHMGNMTMLVRS